MRPFTLLLLIALSQSLIAAENGSYRLRKVAKPDKSFDDPAFAAYTRPVGRAANYQIQGAFGYISGQTSDESLVWGHERDWLVDIEIGKNTLASKEQDFRKIQLGWLFTPRSIDVADLINDPVEANSAPNALLWGLTASYNNDEVKNKSTAIVQLDTALVITKLQTAKFQLTPRAGIFTGRVLDAPTPQLEGSTSAAFVEVGIGIVPSAQWQIGINVKYLSELQVSGRNKVNYHYSDGSLRYLLYSPGATGFKPSIALSRVVGEDPRSGLPKDAYTRFAFELKY